MTPTVFPGDEWESALADLGRGLFRKGDAVKAIVGRPPEQGVTNALLVVHRGRVVIDWNGPDHGPDSTHISWSMAKSMVHALVGIAVGDGLLDPSASGLMPQWTDDRRSAITLQHLLTMTSGLSWVEDYVDDSVSDVIEMLFGVSDFTGDHASYAASKPLVAEPGTSWEYSSGTTNIIARILADALGEPTGSHARVEKFMRTRLFDAIGMRSATPKFDDAGTFVGSSFVYATARDFARFGWLYLNDGIWNGTRILPEGWVDDARTQVALDSEMGYGYGSQWWIPQQDPGSLMAHGYEGQIVWVSPARQLVVVHLGRTPAEHGAMLRDLVWRLVSAFHSDGAAIGHDGADD